jgi:5-methylcytosine-specific restriction endonuclease McrA
MNAQYEKRIEWHREYYQKNRERILAEHAKYKASNKERENRRGREWHRKNYVPSARHVQTPEEREQQKQVYRRRELEKRHASPELRKRHSQRARQWELDNPERKKARSRAWYEANKEKVKTRSAKRQIEQREKINEQNRRRYWNNLDFSRVYRRFSAAKRYSTRRKAPGDYSAEQWISKCQFYGYRCYYCSADVGLSKLEQEHAIPLSRGGTNFLSNILPSCAKCNRRKATKTIFEFTKLNPRVK